jgi:hypothetical protein
LAAIQRRHQLAPKALAEGLLGNELFELGHDIRMAPQSQLRLDPLLTTDKKQLVQTLGLEREDAGLRDVRQRWPPPERERRSEPIGSKPRRTAAKRVLPFAQEPLEARSIDPVAPDLEDVARRTCDHRVVRERRAQPRDVDAQRLLGARRRVAAPQLLDQLVDRDRSAGVEQEQSEERALPSSTELERTTVTRGFDRAEHPELGLRRSRLCHRAWIHSHMPSEAQLPSSPRGAFDSFATRHTMIKISLRTNSKVGGTRGPLVPWFLWSTVLVALVLGGNARSASPPAGASAQPTTVTIATLPLEAAGLAFYAEHRGYFRRQGINAKLLVLSDPTGLVAALLSGQAQFSGVNIGGAAILKSRDAPVRVVAAGALYRPKAPTSALVTTASKGIAGARDLIGKRIAIDAQNTIAHIGLLKWLKRNGVSESEVHLTTIPFAQMLGPLRHGIVDAAMLPEPFLTLALQQHAKRVAAPRRRCARTTAS